MVWHAFGDRSCRINSLENEHGQRYTRKTCALKFLHFRMKFQSRLGPRMVLMYASSIRTAFRILSIRHALKFNSGTNL